MKIKLYEYKKSNPASDSPKELPRVRIHLANPGTAAWSEQSIDAVYDTGATESYLSEQMLKDLGVTPMYLADVDGFNADGSKVSARSGLIDVAIVNINSNYGIGFLRVPVTIAKDALDCLLGGDLMKYMDATMIAANLSGLTPNQKALSSLKLLN